METADRTAYRGASASVFGASLCPDWIGRARTKLLTRFHFTVSNAPLGTASSARSGPPGWYGARERALADLAEISLLIEGGRQPLSLLKGRLPPTGRFNGGRLSLKAAGSPSRRDSRR